MPKKTKNGFPVQSGHQLLQNLPVSFTISTHPNSKGTAMCFQIGASFQYSQVKFRYYLSCDYVWMEGYKVQVACSNTNPKCLGHPKILDLESTQRSNFTSQQPTRKGRKWHEALEEGGWRACTGRNLRRPGQSGWSCLGFGEVWNHLLVSVWRKKSGGFRHHSSFVYNIDPPKI